jgi:membrane-associated phospholipid phosphatase
MTSPDRPPVPGPRAAGIAACLLGFVVLTVLMRAGWGVDALDRVVRDAVAAHPNRTLTRLAADATDVLAPPVDIAVLLLGGAVLAVRRRVAAVAVAAGSVALTLTVVVIGLKVLLGRPGPGTGYPVAFGHGAFPSGHTASVLVCGGALLLFAGPRRRRLAWAVVCALVVLVAGALVEADYHWTSDVVASMLLGAAGLLGLDGILAGRGVTALSAPPAATYDDHLDPA